MTDAQIYLVIVLPSFVTLLGVLVNVSYFVALTRRMTALDTRLSVIEDRQKRR
jgi:hypothetical protein